MFIINRCKSHYCPREREDNRNILCCVECSIRGICSEECKVSKSYTREKLDQFHCVDVNKEVHNR